MDYLDIIGLEDIANLSNEIYLIRAYNTQSVVLNEVFNPPPFYLYRSRDEKRVERNDLWESTHDFQTEAEVIQWRKVYSLWLHTCQKAPIETHVKS